MLTWATLDTCNRNFTLCEVLTFLYGLERSWSAGTLCLPEVIHPSLFQKMLAEQSRELAHVLCWLTEWMNGVVTQFQMLSIFCALWGKCQGPGRGCVIKAATIKEASCGQELLKLLDEQVVPTRGKRQHLQRCCILSWQWDTLNVNEQSLLWFVIPCRATYPSLKDALSANQISCTDWWKLEKWYFYLLEFTH